MGVWELEDAQPHWVVGFVKAHVLTLCVDFRIGQQGTLLPNIWNILWQKGTELIT